MFAFGLWDAERRQLVLARDPYGIKPLYYAYGAGTLQFASSVKALLEGGDVSRQPDAAGIVGFQIFGSVPEPWTTYKAVKSLPAGSFMTIDASGTANTSLYFSLAETYRRAENHGTADPDATSWFRASLLESVRQHLVADVPVGAFLSAGVDSGALVGLMRDAGQSEIRTLTLAFEAFRGTERDESPLAQQVAQLYGTRHTTRWVGAAEFHDDLPKIMAAMDQPSIDGINTWFVSKAAAEIGLKVALSGAGGDELLGGYHTFVRLPALVRKLRLLPSLPGSDRLLGGVASLARKLGLLVHPKAAGLLEYGRSYAGAYLLQRSVYLPFEMQAMIQDDDFLKQGLEELQPLAMIEHLLQPGLKCDFSKIAVLESGFYLRNQLLRDTDWAGMAHSLEIRTPLVDSVLLEKIAPLFTGRKRPDGKALLAAAPSTPLPPAVANRVKTGFGIPVKSWYADKPGDLPDGYSAQASERLWSRTWMKKISALSAEPDQAGCG